MRHRNRNQGIVRRLVGHFLLAITYAGAGIAATGANAMDDWYLLEIADGRPTCFEVDESEGRCFGTSPDIVQFEMRSGERLDVPQGPDVPPGWVRFNRMWVPTAAVTDGLRRRSIELERTPIGARVVINDQGRSYVRSLPLNEWVEMTSELNPKLWVRVAESR